MYRKLIRKKFNYPILITVPHAGSFYPELFLKYYKKDLNFVRKIEDFKIDKVLKFLELESADIIIAECSRAVVDLNRSRKAIDNSMFDKVYEKGIIHEKIMLDYGLGVLPKKISNKPFFSNKLPVSYADFMLNNFYDPFHNFLSHHIKQLVNFSGYCLHIDLHSMPSKALHKFKIEPDIVLGDNFGKSCSIELINHFKSCFNKNGLIVEKNDPYAGGFITRNYGNPSFNIHSIQIEINRKLYMDEKNLLINKNIQEIQKIFSNIFNNFEFNQSSA